MKFLMILTAFLISGAAHIKPIVTYKTDEAKSTLQIGGTSTLHDWEIAAEDLEGKIEVDIYKDSITIKELSLTVPVKSLKSGKSPMDNNTYKALNAETYSTIVYQLTTVKNQVQTSPGRLKLLTEGRLSVAGKTRNLSIPLEAIVSNQGIALRGVTTFSMSSFGVEPPSFMFGKVTTGDKITIHFNINYN